MTKNRLRLADLRRLQDLPSVQRLRRLPDLPSVQRLQRVRDLPYLQRLQRLQDLPYVQRLQRLPRRHRMAAVAAFTVVGVLAGPTAAMASPGSGWNPPVVTEQAASSVAAAMGGSLGPLSPSIAASKADSTVPTGGVATAGDASAVPAIVAPVPPSDGQLHPVAVIAAQQTFTPTAAQLSNARAIVDAGKAMGLPPRAWVIAVATSLQESNLRNLGDLGWANDHDSLGLFQQRPSSGWGTAAQVQDPTYAATAFYRALVNVPGWDTLPLSAAAQTVQVSAFPSAYAKHEIQAGYMIDAFYGVGPYADLAAALRY